jgi:hypothetical protein
MMRINDATAGLFDWNGPTAIKNPLRNRQITLVFK